METFELRPESPTQYARLVAEITLITFVIFYLLVEVTVDFRSYWVIPTERCTRCQINRILNGCVCHLHGANRKVALCAPFCGFFSALPHPCLSNVHPNNFWCKFCCLCRGQGRGVLLFPLKHLGGLNCPPFGQPRSAVTPPPQYWDVILGPNLRGTSAIIKGHILKYSFLIHMHILFSIV